MQQTPGNLDQKIGFASILLSHVSFSFFLSFLLSDRPAHGIRRAGAPADWYDCALTKIMLFRVRYFEELAGVDVHYQLIFRRKR